MLTNINDWWVFSVGEIYCDTEAFWETDSSLADMFFSFTEVRSHSTPRLTLQFYIYHISAADWALALVTNMASVVTPGM